jgi:hypothetical protein
VAAVVEGMDGVVARNECAHHIRIPPAVLPDAVHNGDDRAQTAIRMPRLAVEGQPVSAPEGVFVVLHGAFLPKDLPITLRLADQ